MKWRSSIDASFSARLKKLQEKNLYREPVTFEKNDGQTVTHDGKEYLLFCSNDYLGLSHDSRIVEAVKTGLDEFGYGSGASRLVSGTLAPHALCEQKIAGYLDSEAALLFGSGYAANVGMIPALAGKGDLILADRLIHASLLDGCMLSRAEFKRYSHRDINSLEKLLKKHRRAGNVWIVTDGLFSMDGDLAPLPEICGLAGRYGARVYLDDAHAFGIFGKNGRGSAEHFGVSDGIDVYMGTLGKAAGGLGAFAAGSKTVIDYLKNRARSFVYSTAMPAACALGAAKAVDILSDFGDERKRFWKVTEQFIAELKGLGFETGYQSYIIPLITGETDEALKTARWFWEQGVYMQAIRPPTVPEGSARLRLTLSLAQKEEDRQNLLGLISRKREIFKLMKEPGH